MRVHIGRGGEITVAQPFLDLLHGNAVGQQQAGTAVSQVVEAYPPHAVLLQKVGEPRRQIAALDALPQGIDADVIQVVLAIAPAADLAVFLLVV